MNSEGAGGAAQRPVARDGARRLLILCSALFCHAHGIMCSVCHKRTGMAPEDDLSMNLKVGFSTTRGGTQKYCEWV